MPRLIKLESADLYIEMVVCPVCFGAQRCFMCGSVDSDECDECEHTGMCPVCEGDGEIIRGVVGGGDRVKHIPNAGDC
jgi:hypothetical protein